MKTLYLWCSSTQSLLLLWDCWVIQLPFTVSVTPASKPLCCHASPAMRNCAFLTRSPNKTAPPLGCFFSHPAIAVGKDKPNLFVLSFRSIKLPGWHNPVYHARVWVSAFLWVSLGDAVMVVQGLHWETVVSGPPVHQLLAVLRAQQLKVMRINHFGKGYHGNGLRVIQSNKGVPGLILCHLLIKNCQ